MVKDEQRRVSKYLIPNAQELTNIKYTHTHTHTVRTKQVFNLRVAIVVR